MGQYDTAIMMLTSLGILLFGFLFMRLLSRIIIKVRRATLREKGIQNKPFTTWFEKLFFALILMIALFFSGFTSIEAFAYSFAGLIPEILRLLLIIILGVLLIQLLTGIIKKMVMYTRLEEVVTEEIGKNLIPLLMLTIKVILYVILLQVSIRIVQLPLIDMLVHSVSYPVLILMFVILFVALYNPVRDFSASFYLKNLWAFKVGSSVRYNGEEYIIRRINLLSSELETGKGDCLFVPNRVLSANGILFRKQEFHTLEKIKSNYVAQLPSLCGPASVQIALAMFNIESDQRELAKLAGSIVRKNSKQVAGTHPKSLITAVERFTRGKVKGAWVGFDKIFNLRKEVHTWLDEGALIIVDYKKKYLFPNAERAHYSLALGVRGDELLIVDPGKGGGVYFVDYRDVEVGMNTYSDLIKGKRGYIVLAPAKTVAFQRIVDGLYYHHPSTYQKLSKKLEIRLNKLTSSKGFSDMMPGFVRKYLNESEQVSRVWKP